MPPQPHFGVMVPQFKRTWEESCRAATEFEAMGYDSLWVNDHLYGATSPQTPVLEAWSLLAGLAAVTTRTELGTLVTPTAMRNPAHLGKTIATVDSISGGRVIPGLGAGWMEREFTDFGMPFPPIAARLRHLRESVEFLQGLWSEESVTFEGEFIQSADLHCAPKPARRPPILVGGTGEKVTLRIAAELADIWNNSARRQSLLERKIGVLKAHCADVGRDFGEIAVSQQCLVTIAPDELALAPMVEKAQKIYGGHMGDPAGSIALTGTADQVSRRIQEHLDLGCSMFMIEFFGRDTREPAALFAEKVLPRFR